MKKLIVLSLAFFAIHSVFAQTDSISTKQLVPVESLTGKIKPDTTKLTVTDTTKVDTVYIDNPLNVVKAGVNLPSAYGFAYLSYERVIHYLGSVQIKLEVLGTYNPLSSVSFIDEAYQNTTSMRGIGITPEIRYYGTEKYAPKGAFVGFYVPLQFASVTAPKYIIENNNIYSLPSRNLSYTLAGVGFDAGYQLIFKKKFTLEGLIGIAIARGKFSTEFYTNTVTAPNGVVYEGKIPLQDGTIGRGFYPRAEISFGYAFK